MVACTDGLELPVPAIDVIVGARHFLLRTVKHVTHVHCKQRNPSRAGGSTGIDARVIGLVED